MIVVSGESLLDVFAGAESGNGMALDAVVGGSPLNLAMGLARLGRPVTFFGAVSRDFLGERIERLVRAEGIAAQALVRTDAPTTLSVVGVGADGTPGYRFYGSGGADRPSCRPAPWPCCRPRWRPCTWAPMPAWWSLSRPPCGP